MLTSKQRSYLRGLGNELEPVFQIGKGGLSQELLNQLDTVLEARELIKIRVLKSCPENPKELAQEIADFLDCQIVQTIGRNLILYREAMEKPQITLP